MKLNSSFISSLIKTILFHTASTEGAWYSAEDKVCDPSGSNWSRYSGFRIHRHLVLKHILPPIDHYVTITRCNDGEAVYERIERTPADVDISWDRPICLFKQGLRVTPPSKLKRPINKGSTTKRNLEDDALNNILKLEDVPKKLHNFEPLKRPPPNFHSPQKDEDSKFEKLPGEYEHFLTDTYIKRHLSIKKAMGKYTSFVKTIQRLGGFMDVEGGTQNKDFEEIQPLDIANISEKSDLDNLQCFKMARRKEFQSRRLTLGVPHTFIGGLFLCNINNEAKKAYLESINSQRHELSEASDVLPFHFQCDPSNAIPILPLLLDNMLDSWYTREDWGYRQRIPYLYTPSSFDHRFGIPAEMFGYKTPSSTSYNQAILSPDGNRHYDKWYEEINVNESYSETTNDTENIEMVGTLVVNMYLDMIESLQESLKPLFSDGILDPKESLRAMSPTALEDIILEMLPRLHDTNKIMGYLSQIQSKWDSLKLTKEKFKYDLPPNS